VALAAAVAVLLVFLLAQRQTVDVSYGRSPTGTPAAAAGTAGQSDATVPSVAAMTAMVAADTVVRLPGAIASFDERRVREAAGEEPVRVLVAPPGLDEDEQDRVGDVENADIRIVGTEVSGGVYQASSDRIAGWRAQFATGDVTDLMIAILTADRDRPTPDDVDAVVRRAPTAAELAAVLPDLRRDRLHVADGATLDTLPASAGTAFPDTPAVVLALPRQPYGRPVPHFGPALTAAFPGTPVVVMYGDWIEYDGPQREDFAELTAASFYGQYGDLLSAAAYPQRNVLGVYLGRVTDVRWAGLFDRPLPYRPWDPLRVALPALPWLFAACVLAFLVLSVTELRRRRAPRAGAARLAGLTALAIDMSALTRDAALTRGITLLGSAADAVDEELPDRHVRSLLNRAEAELDTAARSLPYRGYRPADYLS
jgi:hypothetical protein